MAELNRHERFTLADLSTHPAWEALRKVAKQRMEKDFQRMTKNLMLYGDVPRTEVEFHRGFFVGMKYLLDNPGLEAAKLQRELSSERTEVDA